MEFIDYQTFESAADNNPDSSDGHGNVQLPEPVSRLNISSFTLDYKPLKENFKLPSIISNVEASLLQGPSAKDSDFTAPQKLKKDMSNMYEKMSVYADLSIQNFRGNASETANKNSTPAIKSSNPSTIEPIPVDQEKSSQVLAKKLSKVLNEYDVNSYQHTIKLRKSLKILENNRDKLSINEDKLISPDYKGTLARKSLRTDLETQLLKDHVMVLEDFKPIVRRIKRLAGPVQQIENLGDKILADNTNLSSKEFVTKIEEYRKKTQQLALKKYLLASLKVKFTLSQVEDDLVENGPVNEEIFDIINKLIRIKEHATYLLALPNSNSGSVLISKANRTMDMINKKIFNFLIDYMYNFESNSSIGNKNALYTEDQSVAIFQKGLVYLSNDLQYYDEFIKRITTMRSKSLLDEFLSQFDMNSKASKAIVLSAHDPVRYIGDVLATVHSMIANEVDFVKSLFKFRDSNMEGVSDILGGKNSEFFDGLDIKLVNDIVQYLSNSCKIRIEQVIRFEENRKTNYNIVQLLDLYVLMFEKKGILANNPLITNLINLRQLSSEKIIESLSNFTESIKEENVASADLMAPEWVSTYLSMLVELFDEVEGDVNGSSSENNSSDGNYLFPYKVLQKLIEEPFFGILLKQLKKSYPLATKKEDVRIKLLTQQINCFETINFRIQPYSLSIFSYDSDCKSLLQKFELTLNDSIERLQKLQISQLFEKTGLNLYNNLINMIFPIDSIQDELDYDMYLSLADNSLMSLENVEKNVHEKLNEYLPQALPDLQDNLLFKLTSPSIADNICETCFASLSKFYSAFRNILRHIYPDDVEKVELILNFSVTEFKTLTGVE
ncbi:Conserved oligomeric Golgi complex subunit 6 [Nakaseomyces bracarensis]|uniref:Conserved oligomeric Golgi complex subunit 6 n=1 Tax=Nakaseomyces bracarensis TaxID=273131 RepID=A0ABR4NRD0_9SACH